MPLRSRWSQWCAFRSWIRTQSTPFLPFTTPISLGRSAKFASTGSSDPSDPHDVELARKWLKAFESGVKSIPRHVGQVSFSRSSGPGGQNALVIQSDESRQQATNVDLCYAKLNRLLVISAKEVIPGETSQEQKDRVSKLQRAQNEARLKEKKIHSSKKSNRRGSKYDD
ncbi:hypothetical protein PENSUB_10389 [Penicillium subrubescens]|uniref:Prokaryotic-type class I peptide chain release factors domain-containing protein n=1 Tax=Penicillium subrubescens TaxID=1316194 RepID=A0A1Q5T9S3_9EURO|nr:hypothetical protein PENSUB_10389 [Penicillium subrubescens]